MSNYFTAMLFVMMLGMVFLVEVECFSAGAAGNMHAAGKKRDKM